MPGLSVFLPDIGGASLCCTELTVMDSALLANPQLSLSGYAGVKNFVGTTHPDVIETHEPWANVGHLYEDHVLDGYGVVEVQGKYLFLRDDLYRQLQRHGYPELADEGDHSPCVTEGEAARIKPTDLLYLVLRAKCIVISKEPLKL